MRIVTRFLAWGVAFFVLWPSMAHAQLAFPAISVDAVGRCVMPISPAAGTSSESVTTSTVVPTATYKLTDITDNQFTL
jgi:hypothetical protein